MTDPRSAVPTHVVCTELERGAILLNIETGFYYSLNETGLELWRLFANGAVGTSQLRSRASSGGGDPTMARSVDAFVERLVLEGLVQPTAPNGGAAGSDSVELPLLTGSSEPPELTRHAEPLHDVPSAIFDPQLPLAE